jgi:hypothetical protein
VGVGVGDGFGVTVGFGVRTGDGVAGFGVGVRATVDRGVAEGRGVGDSVGETVVSGVGLELGRVIDVLGEGSGDSLGSGEI